MVRERVEEYLAAIYRLRSDAETPVPLSQLRTYFDFSAMSVHEMIQKLEKAGWLDYLKYRGVSLTPEGEAVALAVLRRHRLWERFLTDTLQMRNEDAHQIAHRLEHAASEDVTQRLAEFLMVSDSGDSDQVSPILPGFNHSGERNLAYVAPGTLIEVIAISPETPGRLKRVQQWALTTGVRIQVTTQTEMGTHIRNGDRQHFIPAGDAEAIWTLSCGSETSCTHTEAFISENSFMEAQDNGTPR